MIYCSLKLKLWFLGGSRSTLAAVTVHFPPRTPGCGELSPWNRTVIDRRLKCSPAPLLAQSLFQQAQDRIAQMGMSSGLNAAYSWKWPFYNYLLAHGRVSQAAPGQPCSSSQVPARGFAYKHIKGQGSLIFLTLPFHTRMRKGIKATIPRHHQHLNNTCFVLIRPLMHRSVWFIQQRSVSWLCSPPIRALH